IMAVTILFAVGFVVFLVVAHQVSQGEPIMGGNEVDAGIRPPTTPAIKVAAPSQAVGQVTHQSSISLPKTPHSVTIFPVPFGPQHREVPYLIAALTEIPRLSYQLHLGQHWILVDDIEERA